MQVYKFHLSIKIARLSNESRGILTILTMLHLVAEIYGNNYMFNIQMLVTTDPKYKKYINVHMLLELQ